MVLLLIMQLAAAVFEPATPETYRIAFQEIDAKLIDGTSARFRDVRASRTRVCGMVNARNRMGGYTGWQPFSALIVDDEAVVSIGEDEADMIAIFCTGEGAPTRDGTDGMQQAASEAR